MEPHKSLDTAGLKRKLDADSPRPSPWGTAPSDILRLIFSFFPEHVSIAVFAMVSRHWLAAVRAMPIALPALTVEGLLHALYRFSHVTSMQNLPQPVLPPHTLRHLTVTLDTDEYQLTVAQTRLSSLTSLRVYAMPITRPLVAAVASTLTHLTLKAGMGDPITLLTGLSLPQLTSLDVITKGVEEEEIDKATYPLALLRQLKTLTFRGGWGLRQVLPVMAALPLPMLSTLQLFEGACYFPLMVRCCSSLTALGLDPRFVAANDHVQWGLVRRVSFGETPAPLPAELPTLTHLSFDSPLFGVRETFDRFTNLRCLTFRVADILPSPPMPSLTSLTIKDLRVPSLRLTLENVMKKFPSVRHITLGLRNCNLRSYETCVLQQMEEAGVERVALYEVGSHKQRLRELRGVLKGWMQLVVTDNALSGPFPE